MAQGIRDLGRVQGMVISWSLEAPPLRRELESLDTFAMGEGHCSPARGYHVFLAEWLMRGSPLMRARECCLKPQTETLILISILIPVHLEKQKQL